MEVAVSDEAGQVLYDYGASGPTQITLQAGEHVGILNRTSAEWWYVRRLSDGNEGYAPANYIKPLERQSSNQSAAKVVAAARESPVAASTATRGRTGPSAELAAAREALVVLGSDSSSVTSSGGTSPPSSQRSGDSRGRGRRSRRPQALNPKQAAAAARQTAAAVVHSRSSGEPYTAKLVGSGDSEEPLTPAQYEAMVAKAAALQARLDTALAAVAAQRKEKEALEEELAAVRTDAMGAAVAERDAAMAEAAEARRQRHAAELSRDAALSETAAVKKELLRASQLLFTLKNTMDRTVKAHTAEIAQIRQEAAEGAVAALAGSRSEAALSMAATEPMTTAGKWFEPMLDSASPTVGSPGTAGQKSAPRRDDEAGPNPSLDPLERVDRTNDGGLRSNRRRPASAPSKAVQIAPRETMLYPNGHRPHSGKPPVRGARPRSAAARRSSTERRAANGHLQPAADRAISDDVPLLQRQRPASAKPASNRGLRPGSAKLRQHRRPCSAPPPRQLASGATGAVSVSRLAVPASTAKLYASPSPAGRRVGRSTTVRTAPIQTGQRDAEQAAAAAAAWTQSYTKLLRPPGAGQRRRQPMEAG
eukprot:SAG31_NODE_22_length_33849_cov_13.713096_20_plen_592_part_00